MSIGSVCKTGSDEYSYEINCTLVSVLQSHGCRQSVPPLREGIETRGFSEVNDAGTKSLVHCVPCAPTKAPMRSNQAVEIRSSADPEHAISPKGHDMNRCFCVEFRVHRSRHHRFSKQFSTNRNDSGKMLHSLAIARRRSVSVRKLAQ